MTVLMGLTNLLLAGLLAPTIYAAEDGSFPIFPTIIGDASERGGASSTASTTSNTFISPAPPLKVEKTSTSKTTVKQASAASAENKEDTLKEKDYVVTNKQGVFSPFGHVKKRIVGDAKVGEGGLTASVLDGVGGFIMWLFIIILLVALAFVSYHYLTLKASSRRATT